MIMVCDSRHHNEFTQLKGTIYSIARKPYGEKKKSRVRGLWFNERVNIQRARE